MTHCNIHENHPHQHGPDCGHTAIKHDGHIDYLHDGHLHHVHGDHVDEHVLAVNETNPATCNPAKTCGCSPDCRCESCNDDCGCSCSDNTHEAGHVHGPDCGHEAIPHGDHVDYIVNGRLHHPHGDHCDDHGPVEIVS